MKNNINKLEVIGGLFVALFCGIVLGCSEAFAADFEAYPLEMDNPDYYVGRNIVVRYQYDPDHEEEVLDEDSNVILSIDPEDNGEGEGEGEGKIRLPRRMIMAVTPMANLPRSKIRLLRSLPILLKIF